MRKRSKKKHQTDSRTSPDNINLINSKKSGEKSPFIWITLAIIFGYAHMKHLENLFENSKHFSHLSTLERELSFRTESGLYYYYFKSLVVDENAKPLNTSLVYLVYDVFLNDNRTEYPDTINSLQRFNLYPELILAMFYRTFNRFGLLKTSCFTVYNDFICCKCLRKCTALFCVSPIWCMYA